MVSIGKEKGRPVKRRSMKNGRGFSEYETVQVFLKEMQREVNKNWVRLNKQITELSRWFLRYEEPYCEISQNHRHFCINMKLPDVQKRDILLKIESNKVEVRGVMRTRVKGKAKIGGFFRKIDIPRDTDQERAHAVFKNSALRIRIPKHQG